MSRAKWRKFTNQQIEAFVEESSSYASLAEKLGYDTNSGSYLTTMKVMVKELGIDVPHFTGQGWHKNGFDYSRFKKGNAIKSAKAVDALAHIRGHKCECCGLEMWNNQPIPLQVHHVDGDRTNNEMENLKLLCPNCHAQTDNYCGKNIGKKDKIPDDVFIRALKTNSSIRQALLELNLSAKGANYKRAKELMASNLLN